MNVFIKLFENNNGDISVIKKNGRIECASTFVFKESFNGKSFLNITVLDTLFKISHLMQSPEIYLLYHHVKRLKSKVRQAVLWIWHQQYD